MMEYDGTTQMDDAGIHLIPIPAGISLLESEGHKFCKTIAQTVIDLENQATPATTIIFLQTHPANDNSATWLSELDNVILLDQLAERIELFRNLLFLIRNSTIPCFYASTSSCYGSFWDLAMACHRRFWLATDVKVGFPEIATRAFPPGGALEQLAKVNKKTREEWDKKHVMLAFQAFQDGFIDCCIDTNRPAEDAKAFALATVSSSILPIKVRKKEMESLWTQTTGWQSRQVALDELKHLWKVNQGRIKDRLVAWDYCWELVKEKRKLEKKEDMDTIIAFVMARHYLTDDYKSWLTAGLKEGSTFPRFDLRSRVMKPVILRVNYLLPPTKVIARLLQHGLHVVFTASDKAMLQNVLELASSRLDRFLSTPLIEQLWASQVSWFVDHGHLREGLITDWYLDDRVSFYDLEENITLLRLDGNSASAKCGAAELEIESYKRIEQSQSDLAQLIHLIHEDFFVTSFIGKQNVPLSTYIRGLFFEELIYTSAFRDGDLNDVIDTLTKFGWTFAGLEEDWDKFLRSRHEHFTYEELFSPHGRYADSKVFWNLSSWGQARKLAKKMLYLRGHMDKWSQSAVSQHFALFSGFLAVHLVERKLLPSMKESDRFCKHVLGFPAVYGSPIRNVDRVGFSTAKHHFFNIQRHNKKKSEPISDI